MIPPVHRSLVILVIALGLFLVHYVTSRTVEGLVNYVVSEIVGAILTPITVLVVWYNVVVVTMTEVVRYQAQKQPLNVDPRSPIPMYRSEQAMYAGFIRNATSLVMAVFLSGVAVFYMWTDGEMPPFLYNSNSSHNYAAATGAYTVAILIVTYYLMDWIVAHEAMQTMFHVHHALAIVMCLPLMRWSDEVDIRDVCISGLSIEISTIFLDVYEMLRDWHWAFTATRPLSSVGRTDKDDHHNDYNDRDYEAQRPMHAMTEIVTERKVGQAPGPRRLQSPMTTDTKRTSACWSAQTVAGLLLVVPFVATRILHVPYLFARHLMPFVGRQLRAASTTQSDQLLLVVGTLAALLFIFFNLFSLYLISTKAAKRIAQLRSGHGKKLV